MKELWERAITDLVELFEKWIEVIPPYLADLFHRYMMYGIFKESFLLLLSIVAVILFSRWWYKVLKSDEEYAPASMLFLFPIWLWIVWIIVCWMDLFEAMFIPEVYVIHDLQWCTSCRW